MAYLRDQHDESAHLVDHLTEGTIEHEAISTWCPSRPTRHADTYNSGDQIIVCATCRAEFLLPAGEMEWLRRTFGPDAAVPRRCRSCRAARRRQVASSQIG
jgi:hypothetical protein